MIKKNLHLNYNKALLIFALIIFTFGVVQKYEYSPDDTFIYLKYSQNIANGNNFSFNKDEPSYGVTGPLWVFLNVIPFIIGVNAFWFAKLLDLSFIICSFIIFYKLTYWFWGKDNAHFRFLAVSIFVVNPWIIRSSFTGMETSLAIFLVLSIFYSYYCGKFYVLFFLIGLSILVRPETFLLFFIFMGLILFNSQKAGNLRFSFIAKYAGFTLITTVPFWIFAYFNFGTIVANTSLGKAVFSADMKIIFFNAEEIFRIFFLAAPFETVLALVALILLFFKKQYVKFLPIIFWIFSFLLLYVLTTAAMMSRYVLILYPFVVLLCVKLIENIKLKRVYLIPAFIIFFTVYSGIIFFRFVKPYCDGYTVGVNNCLIPLGKWLNNNTPAGSRVFLVDVGAIGFYADRYIIDAAALINRDLDLNKKIRSAPHFEKEYIYNMLNFIETEYLIEKDTAMTEPLKEIYNYRLEAVKYFIFPQLTVLDSKPIYYIVYKVDKQK